MLEGDAPDQRIGVAVHDLPAVAGSPEDQRDPQRHVLVRQVPDLAVLPLDRGEDDEVSRRVPVLDVEGGLAGGEEPAALLDVLLGETEPAPSLAAEGRHQRVVVRVVEQREVALVVAADVGVGRVVEPGDELGDVGLGHRHHRAMVAPEGARG